MKILQVHKYLYRKAGAEAYVLGFAELLASKGNEVKLWSAGENYDFGKCEGLVKDLKKFGHMVWSFDAAKKFDAVLKEFKPDIIHIHNIYHHISPSILSVAKKYKIPVVMTVHDYQLINPNYTLFDHSKICERNGWRAVARKCIQNSYMASLAGVVAWQIHKWLGVYEKNVARYIAPTEFVKKKLVEGGINKNKIEIMPLPVAHNPSQPPLTLMGGDDRDPPLKARGAGGEGKGYILFSGRLTEEKGIYLLLEIAKQLPDIQFKIAGSSASFRKPSFRCRNVELLGFVEKEKLQELIAGARLVVVPSLWYDPSPYAVLEAMALGKVVVASRIGGISELIKDGETGFLINLRNNEMTTKSTKEWVDKLQKLYRDAGLLERVGKSAREYIEQEHNEEKHYNALLKIYQERLKKFT